MLLSDLTAYLEEEFTYPVDSETIIQQTGDVRIEAPNRDDDETLDTILEPLGKQSYETPEELFRAIYGNVSDDYIGRKFYDDRGGADDGPGEDGPMDEQNVSF